jgi:pimeloyl-ACP methyl ester carboxylesterase
MRRFLYLLASLMLGASLALVAAAPAQAAPARGNTKSNTVIFVHGFSTGGSVACRPNWSNAGSHFRAMGWTGSLETYGLYAADSECTWKHPSATVDTSIKTIGKHLANVIYNNYTSKGLKVDIVAHSMGGLVVRAALMGVRLGESGFPAHLYVEDVVTLATPHTGTSLTALCYLWPDLNQPQQCLDMNPGSAFLDWLGSLGAPAYARLPVSAMGTEWTVMSSFADAVVSEASGVNVYADHRIQYHAGQCTGVEGGLSHTEMRTVSAGSHCLRAQHDHGDWSGWVVRTAPLDRAYLAAYDHDGN